MDNDQKEIDRSLGILVKSSAIVFVGIFLSKLFMYLYRIVIARYYGPEVYGLFSLAAMITGFFVTLASFGLIEGLSRFIPIYRARHERDKIKYLLKISRIILFVSGVFSAVALWILSEFIAISIFHNQELILFLRIFSISIPISLLSGTYFASIRAHEKINAYSFGINILQNGFKLIFVGMFIFLGLKSIEVVSFSYIFPIFIGLIFAYFYSKIKLSKKLLGGKELSRPEKNKMLIGVLSYSWPLILFGIIGNIMFWMDTLLIGYFKNTYFVGIYNAAIPIATLLAISQEIFIQMFFPMITREMHAKRVKTVRELSKQVTKWICIINTPLLVILLIFPGVFINFFFGPEYLFANNSLRFLALGYFVYAITIVSNNLLLSKGKSKLILLNIVVASIINFFLNYSLIPVYGITGAAFSTFLSLFILSIMILVESYYFNKIFPFRRKLLSVGISAIVPAIILTWVSSILEVDLLLLTLLGGLFIIFYLILILLTRALDQNDFRIIRKIWDGITKSVIDRPSIRKIE